MRQGKQNEIYQVKQIPESYYPFYLMLQDNKLKRELALNSADKTLNLYILNVKEEILLSDFFQIIKNFNIKFNISDINILRSYIKQLGNTDLINFEQIIIKKNKNSLEFTQFQGSYVLQYQIYQTQTLYDQLNEFEDYFRCDGDSKTFFDLFLDVQQVLINNSCFSQNYTNFSKSQFKPLYIIKQRLAINIQKPNKYLEQDYYINKLSEDRLFKHFDFFYCAKEENIVEVEILYQELFEKSSQDHILYFLMKISEKFGQNSNKITSQSETEQNELKKTLLQNFSEVINQQISEKFKNNTLLLQRYQQCELVKEEIMKQFNQHYCYLETLPSQNLKQHIQKQLETEIIKKVLLIFLKSYIQFINEEIFQVQNDKIFVEAIKIQTISAITELEQLEWQDFQKVIYNYCNLIKGFAKEDACKIFISQDQFSKLDQQFKQFIHKPNSYQGSLEWLTNKFCSIELILESYQFGNVKKNLQDIQQMNAKILKQFNMIWTTFPCDQRILVQKCYNELITDIELFNSQNQFVFILYSDKFYKKIKEIEQSVLDLPNQKIIKLSSQGVIEEDYQKYLLQLVKVPLKRAYEMKEQKEFIQQFKDALEVIKTKDEQYCQTINNDNNVELKPIEKLFVGLEDDIKNQQLAVVAKEDPNGTTGLVLMTSFLGDKIKELREIEVANLQIKKVIEKIHTLVQNKAKQQLKREIQLPFYQPNYDQNKPPQIEQFQEIVLQYYQQEIYKQLQVF